MFFSQGYNSCSTGRLGFCLPCLTIMVRHLTVGRFGLPYIYVIVLVRYLAGRLPAFFDREEHL